MMPRHTQYTESRETAQAHWTYSRRIKQLLKECLNLIPENMDNPGASQRIEIMETLLRDGLVKTELYQRWVLSKVTPPHTQTALFQGEYSSEDNSEGNSNWDYIDAILDQHRPDITWKKIYTQGKKEGYFSMFPDHATLRSTYHQRKRYQQQQ